MRSLCAASLLFFAAILPLRAGETPWQELAPGVSVRLISAGTMDAGGRALYALEIDMPEDTKTYWRVPGETGLPTVLDFSASKGIAGHDQFWPLPHRDQTDGYLDYVYFGHTVLPFELEVTEATGMVDLQATLGVCSDICVPAQARLVLPALDSRPDGANGLRIKQALAEVPILWQQGPQPAGDVRVSEDGLALLVEIDHTIVDPESLIVAGDLDAPLFGAPQKSPQHDLVLLPIMGKTDNSVLNGMEVQLSFMTAMGAYEVTRTIEAGADAIGEVQDQ